MANLYMLTNELEDLMENPDATQEELTQVFGDIQEKAQSICEFMATLGGDIETFKTEEKRIAERRKAMENKLAAVKEYLRENMERLMIDKLKAGTFTVSLQDSPPSVVVDEESAIPPRFFTIVPESLVVNKKALAEELKHGTVLGCHLEQKKHIRVR